MEQLSIQQLWNYDPRHRDSHCAGQLCLGSGLKTYEEMASGLITTPRSSSESVFLSHFEEFEQLDKYTVLVLRGKKGFQRQKLF